MSAIMPVLQLGRPQAPLFHPGSTYTARRNATRQPQRCSAVLGYQTLAQGLGESRRVSAPRALLRLRKRQSGAGSSVRAAGGDGGQAADGTQSAAGTPSSGDVALDDDHWEEVKHQLEKRTKIELQEELRVLSMKMTGKKPVLVESLLTLFKSAAAMGLSPADFRRLQLEKPDVLPAEMQTSQAADREPEEPDVDISTWTVEQLRAALRRRGSAPRGNKADMVRRLKALLDGSQPLEDKPKPKPAARTPWEEEKGAAEDVPVPSPDVDSGLMEARNRKQKELNQLTVTEISNLMKARKIPIGSRKRKSDLVERLLDAIFPTTLASRAELSAAMATDAAFKRWMEAEQRERTALHLARSEMLAAVRAFIPDFNPQQEFLDYSEWPLVAIRRELLEAGLSAVGTREQLLTRLQSQGVPLEKRLGDIMDDEVTELLNRLGVYEVSKDEVEMRQALAEAIRGFQWFAPEISVLETPLIPEQAPSRADAEGKLTVALVAVLSGAEVTGQLALQAAQTIQQHLQTTPASGSGSKGVHVPMYFLDNGAAWRCPAHHLHTSTELDLRATLHLHGKAFTSLQEIIDELKTADVVLPLVTDGNRDLLKELEQAGVEFIGTQYEAGELASHKHQCRQRLEELGFPTVPQLHVTAEDFDDSEEDWQEKLERRTLEWAEAHGIDDSRTGLLVKPVFSSSAMGLTVGEGLAGALVSAEQLLSVGSPGAVIEPLLRNVVEFAVLVVDTPAGPRASLPLEIELVDAREDFIDAELEVQRFFSKLVEGKTDEELDEELPLIKEATLLTNIDMLIYDTEKKHEPTGLSRVRSPIRLPVELTMAIRDAACKAFKELGLRDYARIDGFVQLPPKPPQKREKPAELANYRVPTVEEAAGKLRPSDNIAAGLAPPWDPPSEEEDPLEVYRPLLEDGGWENMGPYTDPEVAKNYHSNDVELRLVQKTGSVLGDIMEEVHEVTEYSEEELEEILADGAEWEDEHFVPDDLMGLEYSDDFPGWNAETKKWDSLDVVTEEDMEADAMHDDVDPPDLDETNPAELCRWEAGTVIISDVNVCPSLEGTGLVFQAALQSGLTQASLLRHLASEAARRRGLPSLPALPAASLADTFLAQPEPAKPFDSWDNYPPVTERDMKLPWWHERFKAPIFEHEEPVDVQLEGPLSKQLQQGEDSEDEAESLGADEEQAGPSYRQRVWVLCGGEGTQADLSLISGLHVYEELSKQPDLLVELFVLSVPCGGSQVRKRRVELLRKHVERIKITSNVDVEQPPELQLENIRNPPLAPVELLMREVWAVPQHLALRNSVVEVQEACEEALAELSTVERLQTPWQRDAHRLRCFVRDQLKQAGVEASGHAWGAEREPTAPKLLDLYEFGVRAGVADALIFSVLHGGVGEDGQVQELMESLGVPFVGSPAQATVACADKGRTAEAVADLDMQVIETLAKLPLRLDRLLKDTMDGDALRKLFQAALSQLGLQEGEPMCIKPAGVGGGAGVARIDSAQDLAQYAAYLRQRRLAIPALTLSWDNPDLPLPAQQPSQFLIEPYIPADSLTLEFEEGTANVEWLGQSRQVEVSVAVLGSKGRMRALTPCIMARGPALKLVLEELAPVSEEGEGEYDGSGFDEAGNATPDDAGEAEDGDVEEEEQPIRIPRVPIAQGEELADEDKVAYLETDVEVEPVEREVIQAGAPIALCPPPEHVVPPLVLASVQERAEIVAERLGLSGYATLEGFMDADTGNLVILSVNVLPPLDPGSPFLAQLTAQDPSASPGQLMRKLARIALQGPPEGHTAEEESPSLPAVAEFPPLMTTQPSGSEIEGGAGIAMGSPA